MTPEDKKKLLDAATNLVNHNIVCCTFFENEHVRNWINCVLEVTKSNLETTDVMPHRRKIIQTAENAILNTEEMIYMHVDTLVKHGVTLGVDGYKAILIY